MMIDQIINLREVNIKNVSLFLSKAKGAFSEDLWWVADGLCVYPKLNKILNILKADIKDS